MVHGAWGCISVQWLLYGALLHVACLKRKVVLHENQYLRQHRARRVVTRRHVRQPCVQPSARHVRRVHLRRSNPGVLLSTHTGGTLSRGRAWPPARRERPVGRSFGLRVPPCWRTRRRLGYAGTALQCRLLPVLQYLRHKVVDVVDVVAAVCRYRVPGCTGCAAEYKHRSTTRGPTARTVLRLLPLYYHSMPTSAAEADRPAPHRHRAVPHGTGLVHV